MAAYYLVGALCLIAGGWWILAGQAGLGELWIVVALLWVVAGR